MKTLTHTLIAAVLLCTACSSDKNVNADGDAPEVTFSFFYDRLAPHGDWVEVADHGWCWHPHGIGADWRPYTHGHWVYTDDCGWYWDSDEDWGWACFHYGRWAWVESRWLWVPGYEWAGAWVAWRHGDEHCGWAPLPPHAHWELGVGFRAGFSIETHVHEPSWVFVSHTHFVSPRLHTVILAPGETTVIIKKARVIGSVSISGGVIMNHAITHEAAVKFTGKPITRVKVRAAGTLGGAKIKAAEGEIRVFRPKVGKGDAKPPRPGDKDRIADAERQTMKEKHEAEDRDVNERKGDKSEREEMEKRHAREREETDKKHGKRDEPRKEEPRKEEPRKEEPRKGEPRKEEPRKEEPRKEEPRKEEPRKEEPRKEDPKKEPGKEPGKGGKRGR